MRTGRGVQRIAGIKPYDDLWSAQRKYLAERRGSDKLPPPPGFGFGQMDIPRSTNADVLKLATYWTRARRCAPGQVMGYAGVKAGGSDHAPTRQAG